VDISTSQFKQSLSFDLIFYLMNMIVRNDSNKIESISNILDKWKLRVDNATKLSTSNQIKEFKSKYDISEDIAAILISIYQIENNIIYKEFLDQVKQILLSHHKTSQMGP